ncbi:hypothetical protein Pla52o_31420 [Novipirellula galeiformis]|uniref:Uncharacterized protein n=1 Tax=Novipirellula galeiformis TaxID=2528004 RepID=A0A5C6CEZ9_9BACT|nr:hypothetical protein [Novipirellula galeiformis]TWU22094.1 hypothetical protein Pla52o_31420 [Novipirellula galeiformis]
MKIDATNIEPNSQSGDRNAAPLRWFLRAVGGITLLAFAAAVMPEKWMIEIGEALGVDPFPAAPLTFYLARHLSALYGFVGIGLLVLANDLVRYRPLVKPLALGTIGFGLIQFVIDAMSGLPAWWTFGESISTLLGGCMIAWLNRHGGGRGARDHAV